MSQTLRGVCSTCQQVIPAIRTYVNDGENPDDKKIAVICRDHDFCGEWCEGSQMFVETVVQDIKLEPLKINESVLFYNNPNFERMIGKVVQFSSQYCLTPVVGILRDFQETENFGFFTIEVDGVNRLMKM